MVDNVCDALYDTCSRLSYQAFFDLSDEIARIYDGETDLEDSEQVACDVIIDALRSAKECKADVIPTYLLPTIVSADPDGFAIYYDFGSGDTEATIVYDSVEDGAAAMTIPVSDFSASDGAYGLSRKFGCEVPVFEIAPSDVKVNPKKFGELVGKMLKGKLNPEDGTFTLHWKNGDPVEFGQEFRAYSAGDSGLTIHTVDSVNLQSFKDGKAQAWIYHDNTGYNLSVCEPIRNNNSFTATTTYNEAPVKSGKFVCHRCKAEFSFKDVTYCPKCGRRVL